MLKGLYRHFHVKINEKRYDYLAVLLSLFALGFYFTCWCYTHGAFVEKCYCQFIECLITVNSLFLTITVTTLSILLAPGNKNKASHIRIIKTSILIDVVFGFILVFIDVFSLLCDELWVRSIVIGFELPYFISTGTSVFVMLNPDWHEVVDTNDEKWKNKMSQLKQIKESYRQLSEYLDKTSDEISYFTQVKALDITEDDKKFLLGLHDSIEDMNIGKTIPKIEEIQERLDALMKSIMI